MSICAESICEVPVCYTLCTYPVLSDNILVEEFSKEIGIEGFSTFEFTLFAAITVDYNLDWTHDVDINNTLAIEFGSSSISILTTDYLNIDFYSLVDRDTYNYVTDWTTNVYSQLKLLNIENLVSISYTPNLSYTFISSVNINDDLNIDTIIELSLIDIIPLVYSVRIFGDCGECIEFISISSTTGEFITVDWVLTNLSTNIINIEFGGTAIELYVGQNIVLEFISTLNPIDNFINDFISQSYSAFNSHSLEFQNGVFNIEDYAMGYCGNILTNPPLVFTYFSPCVLISDVAAEFTQYTELLQYNINIEFGISCNINYDLPLDFGFVYYTAFTWKVDQRGFGWELLAIANNWVVNTKEVGWTPDVKVEEWYVDQNITSWIPDIKTYVWKPEIKRLYWELEL